MSSIVVSRSGDFCVIAQQLLGGADDRLREPCIIQYVKNLREDSCIRDMRAIPSQKIVYVMVGNHCDMKGIDARGSRKNRFPQDLFGDVQDRLLEGQERDARQFLESTLSEGGITSTAGDQRLDRQHRPAAEQALPRRAGGGLGGRHGRRRKSGTNSGTNRGRQRSSGAINPA